MSRESLRFEHLQVRRMPGFETEGFTLEGLSPGINLIHGPNGVGKSTTARAIERLLWPEAHGGDRISVMGRLRVSGEEWVIDVDGSRASHQRGGVNASPPTLPPADDHHRYRLSLHDLLRERDEGFAAIIARESAGGFDVRESGAILDPREPLNRRRTENEELDRAREALRNAESEQQELRARELLLQDLRSRRDGAQEALARVAVLEAAVDHAVARDASLVRRAELERFPAAMAHVTGKEHASLCDLRERLRKIDEELRRVEDAATTARSTIGAQAISDKALRPEVLHGLEQDLADLRAAEQEAARATRARESAAGRLADEAARISGTVEPVRLARMDEGAMAELAAFARRAGEVTAERQVLEQQLRRLSDSGSSDDVARLEDGVRLLRRWLRDGGPAPAAEAEGAFSAGNAGIAAALLLVVLGAALAVANHPAYVAVALLGGALLVPLLRRRSPVAVVADVREVYRGEYERLGLGRPEPWEPAAVEEALGGLEDRLVAARTAAERAERRREVEEELRATARAEQEMATARAEVAERLGVTPEMSLAALLWLAERVNRWLAAHAEVAAADAARAVARGEAERLASTLRTRLESLGFPQLGTVGEIGGAVQAFRDHRQAVERAQTELSRAAADRQRLEQERRGADESIRNLFAVLNLDPADDERVREWCSWHEQYVRARDAERDAASLLRGAQARLASQGGDAAIAEWGGLPQPDIEARLAEERGVAAERERCAEEIAATEALIEKAKRSHDIEAALERIDRAEEALRVARERDVRSAIARELIDYLEAATRDQQLPAVFLRARAIFARITQGRYELRLQHDGEPEFTAFDHQDRRGRTLDELSSGTRVQLLLAVRVAFVEQQERGLRLPLVLDEVLGNSDDERARAIMDAVVELARDGRQIFYFTAQVDEVARWRPLVGGEEEAVELREIDLQQVRRLERRLEIPPVLPAPRRLPPRPQGADHAAYGRLLSVPRLERATAEVSEVHLWYLVEDPEVLHRLLQIGPERWGPLQALVRDGGRPLVPEGLFTELEMCARAAEAFLEAARIGVGRPVDRGVLESSRAVTPTFLDRVEELARRLGGDGARLMEALEGGAVLRFNQRSKEGLREYLEAQGYLTQEAPLELDEIRLRVLARASGEVAEGIGIERLDRLVGLLWRGIASDPSSAAPLPRVES